MELIKISTSKISRILEKIRDVKIAVYGDFCLDAYWIMDPRGSEMSVETGLKAEAVKYHYYSPGGASNIAANLATLKPKKIQAIGVIGKDIFGRKLTSLLNELGINTETLYCQSEKFDTYTFVKKYLNDEEGPRLDFGRYNSRSPEADDFILEKLRDALKTHDAVIFNQQVPGSLSNSSFIDKTNELFREFDNKIILLDSRHYNERFNRVYRKVNEIEIARLSGIQKKPGDNIPLNEIKKYGRKVQEKENKPLFVTCGDRGIFAFDRSGISHVPGIQFRKKVDPVGAGDTALSALTLSLAAGFSTGDAAAFANLAAAVTVQKNLTTGTAEGKEILQLGRSPDYIYHPDLAENIEQADYLPGTTIEICDHQLLKEKFPVKCAVFDHDGTISKLRNGWEKVMEKTMLKAITGYDHPVEEKIMLRIREYIEKSTGIQTYLQMEELKDLVEEFQLVPEEERMDATGYKKMYLDALMEQVNERLQGLENGDLFREDFVIKGSIDFLKALRQRGIHLFLASGTDQPDVVKEARILGYADLFDGGIFGSQDDIDKFSKKLVIQRVIKEYNLSKGELMVAGDGPVEIMEGKKRECLPIGVASDESDSDQVNVGKRRRLIKAGAGIIIPDFSEHREILKMIEQT